MSPDESRAFVDKLRTNSSAVVAYAEVPRGQHAFDAVASVRTSHVINGVAPLPQPRPLRIPPDSTIVDDGISVCRRRPGRPPLTCSPTPQAPSPSIRALRYRWRDWLLARLGGLSDDEY